MNLNFKILSPTSPFNFYSHPYPLLLPALICISSKNSQTQHSSSPNPTAFVAPEASPHVRIYSADISSLLWPNSSWWCHFSCLYFLFPASLYIPWQQRLYPTFLPHSLCPCITSGTWQVFLKLSTSKPLASTHSNTSWKCKMKEDGKRRSEKGKREGRTRQRIRDDQSRKKWARQTPTIFGLNFTERWSESKSQCC